MHMSNTMLNIIGVSQWVAILTKSVLSSNFSLMLTHTYTQSSYLVKPICLHNNDVLKKIKVFPVFFFCV